MAFTDTRNSNPRRRSVNIVFGEPEGGLRMALRNALSREGYESVRDFDKVDGLKEAVTKTEPDLLILDAMMDASEPEGLIQAIRHGRVGKNPFVPAIVTVWEPTQELVQRVASSGTDDLLVKPISPAQLFDRIKILASENRKPFVVTSDYIGPDRRNDANRASEIKSIAVPNTLRSKVKGETVDPNAARQVIERASAQINDMKLKRNAFQISFLVELIMPEFQKRQVSAALEEGISRLVTVVQDTGARMKGTKYEHVSDLCSSILGVALSLHDTLGHPDRKDVELLKPLSDAILLGFNPGSDAESMSGQITSAISNYKKRVSD